MDKSKLNEVENKFTMNILTHLDFLIFDRISKTPQLVIEVDGVSYHKEGTRQKERDIMKDEILSKYGLPILRLKTNGSNERQLIVEKLLSIKK
jgi:very-short-patch-repair endonuclease